MLSRAPPFAMITAMKKLLFVLLPMLVLCALVFTFAPLPEAGVVSADGADGAGQYAAVNKNNVYFYGQPDESAPLFVLPYTYFVRILAREGEFVRVQYAAAEGYCRASDVVAVSFVPHVPFLEKTVDFVYTLDDPGKAGAEELLSVTRTYDYYGHIYENGCLYYCVLADGDLKRIPAKKLLDYELNTEYSDYVAALPAAAEEEGGLSAAAIVGICVGCVAAVGVAVLVARGKRPPAYDPDKAEF